MGKSPREIFRLGVHLGFVPEDRLGMGLVASMGMVGNMMLKTYDQNKGPFVDPKPARSQAENLVKRLSIVTPSVDTPVRLMSGGNVQKVLLGREIESNPQVLITAYPVRGLDINSSYTVYDLLSEQKKQGVAHPLYWRRSGRAARAVRPHPGALPRAGDRRGRCALHDKGRNRHAHGGRRKGGGSMIRVVKTQEKTARQMAAIRLGAFVLALAAGRPVHPAARL